MKIQEAIRVRQVLNLYRERYFDLIVLHFHEKLGAEHGITLYYTWVKTALQTPGLVAKDARPSSHRKARLRPPLPGVLLRADASTHSWIPGLEVRQDLIGVLDDATQQNLLRPVCPLGEYADYDGCSESPHRAARPLMRPLHRSSQPLCDHPHPGAKPPSAAAAFWPNPD